MIRSGATPLVSLTFDDGLPQHLDHALPVMNDAGLPGTFYVHLAAKTLTERRQDWQQAAASGHELGNHTIFHPATETKAWVTAGDAIERYSQERMAMELEVANRWLQVLDGESTRTFAYPCSNPYLGRHGWGVWMLHRLGLRYTRWPGLLERWGGDWGATRQSYSPTVRRLFPAARGGGLTLRDTPPPHAQLDRHSLLSAAVDADPLPVLQQFVMRSLAAGGWAILQFHGIGGGHRLDCDLNVFRGLVQWLAAEYAAQVVTIREGACRLWPELPVTSPAPASAPR